MNELEVKNRGGSSTTTAFVRNVDYNARGQRTLIEYAGSSSAAFSTEYAYDAMTFRLSNQTTTRASDSAVLQDFSPVYDPVGNIVELIDDADQSLYFTDTSAPALVANAGQYTYDPIYRLMSATGREHPGQGPVADSEVSAAAIPHPNDSSAMRAYVESYSYDEVGNILEMDHDCAGTTYDWTRTNTYASSNNRLATSQITGSSSFTYTHDDRGNMTAMPHLSVIGWDWADRMQSADLGGGGDVFFSYDSGGQRVRKVWDKTSSLRDERIYLGAFELWRESTVSGGVPTVQEERQTVHVMDDVRRVAMVETLTVTGEDAVSSPTPRQRYQLSNQIDSASVELTEDGDVISYEEYFPFGATSFRSASGSVDVSAKRYRYTGKERDEETGLYYHGARYYASWLGRWTAADPSGLKDGTNRYGYVGNRPLSKSDPTGRQSHDVQNLDAGASRTQKADDTSAFKANVESQKGAALIPGGAAPQKEAQQGVALYETNPAANRWAAIETKQGLKAGAIDTMLAPLRAYNALVRIAGGTPIPLPEPFPTDTALASNVRGTTAFVGEQVLVLGAARAITRLGAPAKGAGVAAEGVETSSVGAGASQDVLRSGELGSTKTETSIGAQLRTSTTDPTVVPNKAVDTLASRTPGSVPYDPGKLGRIQANLEKQGVTFTYDASKLAPGTEAQYVVPPQGGPGELIFQPNPSRSAVIEELLHLGQHRATGFAANWPGAVSQLRAIEMATQVRLLNIRTIAWTPEERAQTMAAWNWWRTYYP